VRQAHWQYGVRSRQGVEDWIQRDCALLRTGPFALYGERHAGGEEERGQPWREVVTTRLG